MPKDDTLSYAADLVKRYDRDRFMSGLFAPASRREPLLTLYAFNVEIARIRETVSEPIIGQMRLQWWRDTLIAICQGDGAPKGHPVAESLATVIKTFSLSPAPFLALLDARAQDMSDTPPQTMDDLVLYCRGTSVGLSDLALGILGVEDQESKEAAAKVATAWALTGIARSVRHHALAGRVMLPEQELNAQGLAVQDLQNPESAGPSASILSDLCFIAESYLEEARKAQKRVDLRALPILLSATLADGYLKTMNAAGYQVYEPRMMRQRPAVARLWWNAWRKRF